MEGTLALTTIGMSNRLGDVMLGTLFIIIFLPDLIRRLRRKLS